MPTLSDIGRRFDPLREYIQQASEQLEAFGNRLDSTRQQVNRNTQQINATIESLIQGMEGIRVEIGNVANSMSQLSSASSRNRQTMQQEAATIDDMWAAYKKMGVEIESLNLDLKTLSFTEKEMNKVVQLGNEYNTQRIDSYTALSQKYRALKILIDNMTLSERENTEQGRKLVAAARDMYEQMNLLQQSTGKYQLQVGNYSKAMTGLNIATQQVVRELPVLANGAAMFAIAISNNIPILLDNVMAVKRSNEALIAHKKELLEAAEAARVMGDMEKYATLQTEAEGIKTMSVVKGLASSLFSWQTAIVVVLSVLPGLIKNIQAKRKAQEEEKKAQEESNKAMADASKQIKSLSDLYREIASSIEGEVTELKVLDKILGNTNRSWSDRVDAGKRLKQIFDEELEGFSAEEIAMGKANTLMQQLTEQIYNQAKARATLNKITELTQKIIELEGQEQLIGNWQAGAKSVREYYEAMENAPAGARISAYAQGYVDQYRAIISELKGYKLQIQQLEDQIKPSDLITPEGGGLGGGKEAINKVADYYNDALEAIIGNMGESLQKRLAMLDVAWKKEREKYEEYRNELLRIQKEGNAMERQEAEAQLSNLAMLITAAEQSYINGRKALIQEMLDSYEKAVEDEGDVVENEQKIISTGLKATQKMRDAAAYEEYERSAQTAADKEKLNAQIRDNERLYWTEYLAELRKQGNLTIDEYNRIMAALAKTTQEGTDKMSRGQKGRKYGGIFEALLAQTSQFGEKNKYGQQIIKDEYANFVNALDSSLKTSIQYMDQWIAKRLEMAQIAVQAAQEEVDATKKALDYELEARANGFANRVETEQKELELARKNKQKALAEQKKLEAAQQAMETASQISSLVTATANIWASMTAGTGLLGPVLAAAATALMFGSFAAAKVKAAQVSKMKSEQYGEGTIELLEGGSHASGHDIDLGTKKDGTRRRAEGGEFFAIINKRSSRRFRRTIPDVVNSLNDGTFADKYHRTNQAMGNFAMQLLTGSSPTDVSTLEREVRMIREQGEESRYTDSRGNQVIRYRNLTRKINNQ